MTQSSLYIVATPIGNLEDITLRALRILKEVGIIAAEDTRQTRKLLTHYGIAKKHLVSYHDHNKIKQALYLIERLKSGISVALVSDAGTPGISDPGYYLINKAIEAGIKVIPIPGPSAVITALSISGLPTDSFVFEGFLPSKEAQKKNKLKGLADERRTIIFYESPHRIIETLKDIIEVLGDRRVAAIRELTKIHEEVMRGKVSEILDDITKRTIKGEIVIVLEGQKRETPVDINVSGEVNRVMTEEGISKKEAISIVAKRFGIPKKEVYRRVIKSESPSV
ncbi:MAG: 16S rRNA (cytidine(1402)-2'-O)-methyltransferase [Nitrospirota bacterium]